MKDLSTMFHVLRAARAQSAKILGRHAARGSLGVGLLGMALAGCGGNDSPTTPNADGPGATSGVIEYSRNRNGAGAIVPVLSEGSGGFDSGEVDSPAMAVDSSRPGGDKFLLYYEADGPGGVSIGVVTSPEEDLVPLVVGRTVAVAQGAAGQPHAAGATDPTVVVDKRSGQEAGRYKMWFEGRGGTGGQTSTIMMSVSADGVSWGAPTACTGLAASFASVRVADPSVVLDGSTFRMWFEAIGTSAGGVDGPARIGYAESTDGLSWTVRDAAGNTGSGAAAVFNPAGGTAFDAYTVGSPSVVADPDDAAAPWKMWYEAGDRAGDVENTIGFATSADGRTWRRAELPVLMPSSDAHVPLPFDSGDLEHPCALIDASVPVNLEGHFLLWYTGDAEGSATPNRIGLAKGWTPLP
jgi:hypothetical protein